MENEQTKIACARLKELRTSTGMNQKQFATLFDITESTYSRYESGGIGKMPAPKIGEISNKYKINPAWLLGYKNVDKYLDHKKFSEKTKRVRILGTIAAGVPMLAQEDILGYETVSESSHVDFCLKVKGDSMINARILDGDLVFIREQPDVENGEIAAVLIDDEATLKRVYKLDSTVILRAENPAIPDRIYSKKDARNIRIVGKSILFKSEVR